MAQRICGFVGDFSRPFRSLDCNNLFSSRQTASVRIVLHAHEVMCRGMKVGWHGKKFVWVFLLTFFMHVHIIRGLLRVSAIEKYFFIST